MKPPKMPWDCDFNQLQNLEEATRIMEEQEKDWDLSCDPRTPLEAHLQQMLRRLHVAIKGELNEDRPEVLPSST